MGDKERAAMKEEEEKFLAANNQSWNHGVTTPYTVFLYLPSKKLTNQINLNKNEGVFYKPMAVFQEFSHKEISGDISINRAVYDTEEDKEYAELLHPQIDQVRAFSGYYSVPKVALNLPSAKNDPLVNGRFLSSIGKETYQNHISLDELIFSFGGLFYDDYCSFKDLGLPEDVDPEKISIHLPVELPPYLDRDMLLSPYLQQNHNFYMVNPSRGTVTLLNSFVTNMPSHLSDLKSTKISSRHIFLFGGFELRIKSVSYDESIDRWIIEKEFNLNENGFILDTKTLSFTKIDLIKNPDKEKVVDSNFQIGRLGHAITSNSYERVIIEDSGSSFRTATPSNYTDSSHFSPFIPPDSQRSPSASPLMKTKSAGTTGPSINLSATLHGSAQFPSGKTVINTKLHLNSEPTTPASSSGSHGYFKNHVTKTTTSSSSDSSNKLQKSKSLSSRDSKKNTVNKVFDRLNLHNSSSPISNRQPSPLQPQQSVQLPPQLSQQSFLLQQLQPPSTNQSLLSPSEGSPHVNLLSTYSDQVKQNRSNSGSLHSRPVSPIPQAAVVAPKPIPFKLEDKVTAGVTFDDDQDEVQENICIHPEGVILCENCRNLGEPKKPNDLYGDTVIKPGEALTSVFIFGGFVEYIDNGIKRFIATNDFLRIDLICEGGFFAKNILPEATIYKIVLDQSPTEFPSPRGYFASTLIDYDTESDLNCDWNTFKRPFSPHSVFDEESSSSTSLQSSNSRHPNRSIRIKTPEDFFNHKALLVQGGCNDAKETFPDLYIFKFTTGEWEKMSTFSYKYYKSQEDPLRDDISDTLTEDEQIDSPEIIDAELRACHHTALYYNRLGREFIFFLGGFDNNYLKNYEPKPYKSDKFDVSRLSKYRYATTDYNVNRMLVFNIKTQTWGFYKFFYDMRKNTSSDTLTRLKTTPSLINSNFHFHGSGISLNGKIISITQGLVSPVPERKADLEQLTKEFSNTSLMFGGHVQIIFPSL